MLIPHAPPAPPLPLGVAMIGAPFRRPPMFASRLSRALRASGLRAPFAAVPCGKATPPADEKRSMAPPAHVETELVHSSLVARYSDADARGTHHCRAIRDRAERRRWWDGGGLFVLEDLHEGDLPTVKFIGASLRNLPSRRVIVLVFARPEVHAAVPNLWAVRSPSQRSAGASWTACPTV